MDVDDDDNDEDDDYDDEHVLYYDEHILWQQPTPVDMRMQMVALPMMTRRYILL
jgi:hypothetical protein